MDIILAPDCLSFELSNSYVIDDIGTSTNQDLICGYTLKTDYNCCTPQEYAIPATPNVSIAITDCGTTDIALTTYMYYDVEVTTTMAGCCVDSYIAYDVRNNPPTTYPGNTQTFTHRLIFLAADIVAGVVTSSFDIVTTDGYTHNWDYEIDGVVDGNHCVGYSIAISAYNAPTIPVENGITLDLVGNTITLTDTTFNQNADYTTTNPLKEGVYCITIEGRNCNGVPLVDGGAFGQRLYSESVTYFVDCDDKIKCQVAALAATCETADPIWLYESLVYNNTCQTMTCEDVCTVYNKLMEFIKYNCQALPKPCNCG